MTVHRIIEERAARHGDRPAISGAGVTVSYRELNQRANALARHLITDGLRRGAIAAVRLRRTPETAILLLAVLKAGGTYSLIDDECSDGEERRFLDVDVARVLGHSEQSSANLPIVARGSDVACVLQGRDGSPLVMVPHETITALRDKVVPRVVPWAGEPSALDLWLALMTGATVTLDGRSLESAA